MIWKMLKDTWTNFTAPLRPRPPIQDWSDGLLNQGEKEDLVRTNQHIARTTERLKKEIALMARDHHRE